jgi:hypothetical protein
MGSRSVASMQWRGAPSPNRRLFRTINGCSLGHRPHSRCLDAALHHSPDTATMFFCGGAAAICRLRNGRSRACDVRVMAHGAVWPPCSATYGPSPDARGYARGYAPRATAGPARLLLRQRWQSRRTMASVPAPRPTHPASNNRPRCAPALRRHLSQIFKNYRDPPRPLIQGVRMGVRDRLRRGLRTPPVRITSDC